MHTKGLADDLAHAPRLVPTGVDLVVYVRHRVVYHDYLLTLRWRRGWPFPRYTS